MTQWAIPGLSGSRPSTHLRNAAGSPYRSYKSSCAYGALGTGAGEDEAGDPCRHDELDDERFAADGGRLGEQRDGSREGSREEGPSLSRDAPRGR